MTQELRPNSDNAFSNFTGSYTAIDESSYSDADYLTGSSGANGSAEVGLSSGNDPQASSNHVVNFRAWQENKGNQRGLVVKLMQGTTEIASYTVSELPKGTATSYSFTLTSTEADSITNYSDLRLKFESTGDVSMPASQRADVYVSWAEFEIPDSSTHSLTANGITAGSPVLGSPAISQDHDLSADGIVSGAPVLGTPVLSSGMGVDELSADGITAGNPVLGSPAIGQNHVLSANEIVSGSPVVGSVTMTQVHVLTANETISGVPVVSATTLSQVHDLDADDLVSGAPVLGAPVLSDEANVDVLSADWITAGNPILGNPAINQDHVLTATAILAGVPDLESPNLFHNGPGWLEADGIECGVNKGGNRRMELWQ